MKTYYALLRADFWIQTISIITLILLSLIGYGFFIAAIGLIFFGGWQVVSAIVMAAMRKGKVKERVLYLYLVAAYFVMVIGSKEYFNDMLAFLIIFAISLGVFYYIITYRDYKDIDPILTKEEDYPDILDA